MAPEKELLVPADVAPMLGVTTGRIYQMIAAGIIPATRIGRSVRIPRAAWEQYLKGLSRDAVSRCRRIERGRGVAA